MSPSNELLYVSQQLIALAEATPAERFSWRPRSGVRSTGEMYMHIVTANFGLLRVIGLDTPADLSENMEKTVTAKAEVIPWLKTVAGLGYNRTGSGDTRGHAAQGKKP